VDASPYRDEHRRMLNRVSTQVASVIRNSLLFERMQQVSFTDSLTDLPNSRALFAHLQTQFSGSAQVGRESALLMIDLDGFKAINDKHGHQIGDVILRQVGAAIQANIRRSDFCARYAGDEFVVVLTHCGRDEANARALQLQSAIDGMVAEARPGLLLRPSISVGVGLSPEDGESSEELLAAADRRMYEDKQRRRRSAESAPTPNATSIRLVRSA
jgi:diguanylate cyclase (GGDEF)-like protein